jgi:hypothetical protein
MAYHKLELGFTDEVERACAVSSATGPEGFSGGENASGILGTDGAMAGTASSAIWAAPCCKRL